MTLDDTISAAKTAGVVLVVAALGYAAFRAVQAARTAAGQLAELPGAAIDAVTETASQANQATGRAIQEAAATIGVPRTSETECQKAIREGRTWDASFACPAGDFLRYVWGSDSGKIDESGAYR